MSAAGRISRLDESVGCFQSCFIADASSRPRYKNKGCEKEIPRKQPNDPFESCRLSGCRVRFLYSRDGHCESDTHETVTDIYGQSAKAQYRRSMLGVNQLIQVVAL